MGSKSTAHSPAIAFESLWREIHHAESGDVPPRDSVCITEYARINGITRSAAQNELIRMERNGKVEGAIYRVPSTNGFRSVRYFWPAKSRK